MEEWIKKSDVVKAFEDVLDCDFFHVSEETPRERIEAIPSADRPQGEWLDYEIPSEDGGAMPIQVCSLCKTFYPLAYTGGGHRFCPNCGAKMKGADDEDN